MSSELFDGLEGPTNTVADSPGTPVPDPDDLILDTSKRRLVLPVLVSFTVFFTYPLRLGLTSLTGVPIASQTGLELWAATVAFPVLTYLILELRETLQ